MHRRRRLPGGMLRAWPDHLGGGFAERGPHRISCRDPRMDERQYLSLWCVSEHHSRNPTGRFRVKPFDYTRASNIDAVIAAVAIANPAYHATGRRSRELPITTEALLGRRSFSLTANTRLSRRDRHYAR